MYRVLIVEDEENIRTGIANNCDWMGHHFHTAYTASNGQEALEQIALFSPHLVITDIKMPVMDGFELIKTASELYPDLLFGILSGYEEFEYARASLQLNVLDYLLKPCSIDSIHNLLDAAAKKLSQNLAKKRYIEKMEHDYRRIKTLLQEQVLKDYIISTIYKESELLSYKELLPLKGKKLRLLLFHVDEMSQHSDLYSLMTICQEHLSHSHNVYLCTLYNEQVLIVSEYYPYPELLETLLEIKKIFSDYHEKPVTIAVGEPTTLARIKESYQNLYAYLNSLFYIGSGNIITTFDLPSINKPIFVEHFNLEYLTLALRSGNRKELDFILENLFQQLNKPEYDVAQIRAFTIQVYVSIIQQADQRDLFQHLSGIARINDSSSLASIQKIIQETSHEIIASLYENVQRCQNNLVKQIHDLIDKYLADEKLSLGFIAHEILYVNVDYLGKLFKSETGEKFSKYVTNKRIKKAKELFTENHNISVSEVAQLTGFGYNAQYFSKVFKSYTGYTPKEYHNKFCRM